MKYRIIKRGINNPFYVAQYLDAETQEWKTVKDYSTPAFLLMAPSEKTFSTKRAARKALKKIALKQIEERSARLSEEGEL